MFALCLLCCEYCGTALEKEQQTIKIKVYDLTAIYAITPSIKVKAFSNSC